MSQPEIENKNHGVIIIPPRETDFQSEKLSGITFQVNEEDSDWVKYFANQQGEKQHGIYFDSSSCVTCSALRSICLQVNRKIKKGLFSVETLQFLQTRGYLDDQGLFNVSERFTAKMSGTTRVGNTFVAVWDSIRNHGLLPQKKWDFPTEQRTPVFDWNDYYSSIPENLIEEAKEILKYLDISYEWVLSGQQLSAVSRADILRYHLQQAPLQIASPVCRGWNEAGEVPVADCGMRENQHATLIVGINQNDVYFDIDSYIPYLKQLAKDYPFVWVLKGLVEERKVITPLPLIEKFNITIPILYGQKNDLVKKLQGALVKLGRMQERHITGFYWTITQQAVKQLQLENKIVGGLEGKRVGPMTLKLLNNLLWP
jgi:hypothetical protein